MQLVSAPIHKSWGESACHWVKRYVILANGRGPTPAGRLYKEILGENTGAHGLGADNIVRLNNGNREFLQVRGQKRKLLRYLEGDGEDWTYTQAGLKHFNMHPYAEYVVYIPVRIETHEGADGSGRQRGRIRLDYMPWTKFGSNLLRSDHGSEAARRQSVIEEIKRERNAYQTGDTVYEVSGEEATLDESRPWSFTKMGTTPSPGGGPPQTKITTAQVIAAPMNRMQQRVGHRGQASHLPFPDDILAEAWVEVDDRLCVPRQLAVLLNYTAEQICQDFDCQLGGVWWRQLGLTSDEICIFLKEKGIPYHCWVDGHHIWTPAEPQAPRVAWTIHDGHAFYRSGFSLQKP